MAQRMLRIICDHCGTEDVKRDAWAAWNFDSQEWKLHSTYDNAYCERCGDEACLTEARILEGNEDLDVGKIYRFMIPVKNLAGVVAQWARTDSGDDTEAWIMGKVVSKGGLTAKIVYTGPTEDPDDVELHVDITACSEIAEVLD